jgi:dTDP-4-amino-4,6-dideoxygalactose transaminase
MIKFMDLNYQYKEIESELLPQIHTCIHQSEFIGGNGVKGFEAKFANYLDVKYCVGLGNGTDALELGLEGLNLPIGSEVIIPSNSFYASAESVIRQGLIPVFADFCSKTMLITPETVRPCITQNTSAVMPVHLYGNAVDIPALRKILPENIKIIEDCAQAHGATHNNCKIGSLGDVAAWSFYPGKNLGAFGDGGAVTTNNEALAQKVRMLANHGRLTKYDHEIIGRNSRLDNLQAIVLGVKLNHLDKWNARRSENAKVYLEELINIEQIELPFVKENTFCVFHHFVIRTNEKKALVKYLEDHNISTGVHYPKLLPDYEPLKEYKNYSKNMEHNVISLPVAEHLNRANIKYIASKIKDFFNS